MSERHRFRPVVPESLERRVVLDRGARIAPVAIAPLDVSGRRRDLAQAAADQVNQAFDAFTRDYLQAQGAYFAADPGQAPSAARFFRSFIVQRLNLLGQQLTRTFTQLPGSLNRLPNAAPGGSIVLQSFLRTRITGNSPDSLRVALAGPNNPIPPVMTSGTTATLYTSQAISAIETARTSTQNGVGFLLNRTFKNGHR
jgi:hypothetical protein